ncbi:hypothetical protein GF325_11320 [Candidatus Bathyarchaeota archaeon]|nr:hypothetical protein [Candidatus Bathyarchaeota archaeon]
MATAGNESTGSPDSPDSSGGESISVTMRTASTKRVVTGGVILTIFDILGSLFFTLYTIAQSGLPPDEGGVLAVVTSFQAMLKYFAMLGFTGAGAKFISEYLERDKQEARKYGISAAKYNFLVIGLPIVGIAVILFIKKLFEGDNLSIQAFFILIFLMLVDRLRSCSDLYLLAYQRYDLYAISWGIPYGAMYTLAFILLPIYGPVAPLIAWLFGTIAMFLLSMFFVSKISEFPIRDMFSWRKEFGLFKKMFSFNFLYSLANLCFAMLTTTLLITMGSELGFLTQQETQALGVISTFSNILINVFGIVAGIQPAVSQAFSLKNKKLVKNYFLATVKFPLMMTVAVTTFFLVFGREMIEIFYDTNGDGRYAVIGLFIMIVLIPSYSMGAYASRWDNILAGIGRPETAIIPWFMGMGIALVGLVATWIWVPGGRYLVDNIIMIDQEGIMVPTNYGITLQFTVSLISMAAGLVVPGIWIISITIRVLGIKIPRRFITGPMASAFITAIIMLLLKFFIPLKQSLEQLTSRQVGGILYTIAMILLGVMIYLTILVLIGGFTIEDGRFWKSVVGTIPVVKNLLVPLFLYGRFLLKHVPQRMKTRPIKWITTTKRGDMERDSEFTITDDFNQSVGEALHAGKEITFSVFMKGINQKYYHLLVIPKIDMKVLSKAIVYKESIETDLSIPMTFVVPDTLESGYHELYIDVEMYTQPREDINMNILTSRKKFWTYFDFRFKWWDEIIKYITIEDTQTDQETNPANRFNVP